MKKGLDSIQHGPPLVGLGLIDKIYYTASSTCIWKILQEVSKSLHELILG